MNNTLCGFQNHELVTGLDFHLETTSANHSVNPKIFTAGNTIVLHQSILSYPAYSSGMIVTAEDFGGSHVLVRNLGFAVWNYRISYLFLNFCWILGGGGAYVCDPPRPNFGTMPDSIGTAGTQSSTLCERRIVEQSPTWVQCRFVDLNAQVHINYFQLLYSSDDEVLS